VACVPMEYRVRTAKDFVVVLPLDGGGLITYRHADRTYFHTLNTEFGFDRKNGTTGVSSPLIRRSPDSLAMQLMIGGEEIIPFDNPCLRQRL
jgi:hypothetical protein